MNKLTQAIDYAKSGDKASARQLLTEIIQVEPNNELAWLWMSGVVAKTEQQAYCLEQVLRINPGNQHASQGLSRLKTLASPSASQVPAAPEAQAPADRVPTKESHDGAQPIPDISAWTNGFRGWSILDGVKEGIGTPSRLGLLIAESGVAENRILGWAALFILLAALFGFLAILKVLDAMILTGIALVFLGAALYRAVTWYLNKDLKVEIFREGFRFTKAGKTEEVLWREIEHVKEQWQKTVYQGIIHIYTHKVEIHKTDGQKVEMDRSIEKIEEIGRYIQLAVADHLLPIAMEQLQNDQEWDFGAFTISRVGIRHKGKNFLRWKEVKSLEVHTTGQTTLQIHRVDSSKWASGWATENGGALKNLQLFLSLSGWFIDAANSSLTEHVRMTAQETMSGDVHYRLPVTKGEAKDGTQRTLYVGLPMQERKLLVKVPAGVQPGTIYRFPDYGRPQSGNGTAGTLSVEIVVEKVTHLQKKLLEIQMVAGIFVLLLGMMWLSLWSSFDLISSVILALVIGGLAGILISIRQRILGAVSGAVGGAVSFILQVLYYEIMYIVFGRESFWNYEVVILMMLSFLPGIGLYLLLQKITGKT